MKLLRSVRLVPVLLVAASAAFLGCGADGPDLGEVTGTVTFDGRPLAGALVKFQPKAGGTYSSAYTDAEGGYELLFSRKRSGAIVGAHSVSVTTADPDGEAKAAGAERLPTVYNARTELVREVTAGDNVIDFDLKSPARVAHSKR